MRTAIAILAASLILSVFVWQPQVYSGEAPPEATYVGHENCKMCHSDQHKKWEKTRHARAFALLEAVGKTKDESCLPCHTTGYGKEGGYGSNSEVDLRGVQCEACHGPGSEHNGNKEKISRTFPATVCAKCHLQTAIH